MKNYDLAIIGSGPGGYIAGLYASRRKLKVCVIEKSEVGGTCLNRGCIPTKALLHCCAVLSTVKNSGNFGVDVKGYSADFGRMAARKNEVVSRLRAGIETLFRAGGIELVRGRARIAAQDIVEVDGGDPVKAKNIILAPGSRVSGLPGIVMDGASVISSDGALGLDSVPASVAIIGGGVIGCEFASLFNALGSKVTIIEFLDRIIATQSKEASRKLESIFKRRGIDVFTSSGAECVEPGSPVKVRIAGGRQIEAEKALVSVGRIPATDGLGLENAGIKTEKGRIVVDGYLRTSAGNIYAIGDCVAGPMLAHKASYDAILACDNILGAGRKTDYGAIPNCIWTDPEIASVGLSEEEAAGACPGSRTAKFPYLASGKAFVMGKGEGYVKITGDPEGALLGVEIMGESACELIAEAALAKSAGIKIKDWACVTHGHPSLSEMMQEAAHIFTGTPLHGF